MCRRIPSGQADDHVVHPDSAPTRPLVGRRPAGGGGGRPHRHRRRQDLRAARARRGGAAGGRHPDHRPGRERGDHGAVGLGQDDAVARAGRNPHGDRQLGDLAGSRPGPDVGPAAQRAAAPGLRVRVPGGASATRAVGRRERGRATDAGGMATGCGRRRRGGAPPGAGIGGPGTPTAGRAVGWPGAAGRDRPGDGRQPGCGLRRRADRGARPGHVGGRHAPPDRGDPTVRLVAGGGHPRRGGGPVVRAGRADA
jgi:hypothetical protein